MIDAKEHAVRKMSFSAAFNDRLGDMGRDSVGEGEFSVEKVKAEASNWKVGLFKYFGYMAADVITEFGFGTGTTEGNIRYEDNSFQ